MTPQQQQNLEKLVSQAVRDLPPRRAPNSLESRVMAEIARRAALPWWRKSFAHWPLAARVLLVAACAAVIKLVLSVTTWAQAGLGARQLEALFAPELTWFTACARIFHTAADLSSSFVASIPPLWLYGGAAMIAVLYLTLFGLGAAAYRTLYASS